ncbi:MAG TPA: hypothetical protein VKV16_07045, partial [Solirubrobacteraceae bacterium]|nr:hypothetical protein [Solirubrobacteraceae bacterium]
MPRTPCTRRLRGATIALALALVLGGGTGAAAPALAASRSHPPGKHRVAPAEVTFAQGQRGPAVPVTLAPVG